MTSRLLKKENYSHELQLVCKKSEKNEDGFLRQRRMSLWLKPVPSKAAYFAGAEAPSVLLIP